MGWGPQGGLLASQPPRRTGCWKPAHTAGGSGDRAGRPGQGRGAAGSRDAAQASLGASRLVLMFQLLEGGAAPSCGAGTGPCASRQGGRARPGATAGRHGGPATAGGRGRRGPSRPSSSAAPCDVAALGTLVLLKTASGFPGGCTGVLQTLRPPCPFPRTEAYCRGSTTYLYPWSRLLPPR